MFSYLVNIGIIGGADGTTTMLVSSDSYSWLAVLITVVSAVAMLFIALHEHHKNT